MFGNIKILEHDIYTTTHGKRLYITHGDEADSVVTLHPRVAMLGTILYEMLIVINIQINRLRSLLKMRHWSFSEFVKKRVKDAVKFITHFESIIVSKAKQHNCDGVVCGHIHTPAIKYIGDILYCNCGDWIGNLSAIAENFDGEFLLLTVD